MGEVEVVKVGHNGLGNGPEWELDKIQVQRVLKRTLPTCLEYPEGKHVPEVIEEELGEISTFYFDHEVICKGKQYQGRILSRKACH